MYSNVNCGGWEESLSQCKLTRLPDFTCSQKNTAGVLCGYGRLSIFQGDEIIFNFPIKIVN